MKSDHSSGDVIYIPTFSGGESDDSFVLGDCLPVVLNEDAASASPYMAHCVTRTEVDRTVKAHDGLTNVTMIAGDIVYWHGGETPALNADDSGKQYGILTEPTGLASGTTGTVKVLLQGGSPSDATS